MYGRSWPGTRALPIRSSILPDLQVIKDAEEWEDDDMPPHPAPPVRVKRDHSTDVKEDDFQKYPYI